MSFPVGPGGQAVYFSTTSPLQATVTVASSTPIPGALYQVIAYNPNGVASNPITFTVTNTLQKPAFLNPGPQTYVGGGSFSVIQTAASSGLTWSILPTTAVTLSGQSDTGVTVNVSDGTPIASPTNNYTLTATDSAAQTTSQVFTIQNTFNAPAFANPLTKSYNNGGSFSVTQTATQTGQLGWSINPTTGMTLSSASTSGVTVTVSATQPISGVTYTLTATNPTPTSCAQPFSVTNTITALYPFTTFTFTPIGATGPTGPTSLAGYGGTYPGVGTSYALTLSGGIQYWTVPISGTYNITVSGAAGGGVASTPTIGNGAVITLSTSLVVNQVIKILVGQKGTDGNNASAIGGGGGGGSFVYNNTTSVLIAAAGGGGGAGVTGSSAYVSTMNGKNAQLANAGSSGYSNPSTQWQGGAGGTAGNGGGTGTNLYGGGGGGYSGNGSPDTGGSSNFSLSFLNGGTGFGRGGFGGGADEEVGGGGGPGGYSGGGGGGSNKDNLGGGGGGGGGSYDITNVYSGSATNSATGYVTITKV